VHTALKYVWVALVMSAMTEPSTFEAETNEKYKVKSPAADQTLAKFIQAEGEI
jgi:hypothetical protein